MQLKYSLAALACVASLHAEDSISISYLQYNESDSRVSVSAPAISIKKDFGTDYTVDAYIVADAISGATITYIDASSGASGSGGGGSGGDDDDKIFYKNIANPNDITYDKVNFDDTRFAYALNLTKRLENRNEITIGTNISLESDYYSYEFSTGFLQYLDKSKNRSLNYGISYQLNQILVPCDGDIKPARCDTTSGSSEKEDSTTLSAEIGMSQIIDKNSLIQGGVFVRAEDGYLTHPYLNVVRDYNTTPKIVGENRPDSRMGYGITLGYKNAFATNKTLQLDYRLYTDDWGILSNTVTSKYYYEMNDKLTFGLGLRVYVQSEADFYNGNKDYFTNETYASSDERLSSFNALTYSFDTNYHINKQMSTNISLNYYDQSTSLSAMYLNVGFKYKF